MENLFSQFTAPDWIAVLSAHLVKNKKSLSQKGMCVWLTENGCEIAPSNFSAFKHSSDSKPRRKINTEKKQHVINTIKENVDLIDYFTYIERMSFKALDFFSWGGSPSNMPLADRLDGIYQCKRFSFAKPGMITRSLMMFYKHEQIPTYGLNSGVADLSRVYRFREYRNIKTNEKNYNIHTHGFWFQDRGGIMLFGMSVETLSNESFIDLKISDVERMYTERLDLFNDRNKNIAYGHHHTFIKNGGIPATAFIHLDKLDQYSASNSDWKHGLKSIEINVTDPTEDDVELLYNQKRYDNIYKMLMAASPID